MLRKFCLVSGVLLLDRPLLMCQPPIPFGLGFVYDQVDLAASATDDLCAAIAPL